MAAVMRICNSLSDYIISTQALLSLCQQSFLAAWSCLSGHASWLSACCW